MERFPKSLISFQRMFPDEAACAAWLFSMRWPEGFQCPGCGHDHGWALRAKAHTFECTSCHRQTSVTAGTILHGSKLDLTVWFWAAYLMATHSNGISALQLQKQLALGSYRTAWMLAAKLRRAMVDPDRNPLSGLVEIDETSLPFRTKNDPAGGGPGRSHDGKLLVVWHRSWATATSRADSPGRSHRLRCRQSQAFIARMTSPRPAPPRPIPDGRGYAGVPVNQHAFPKSSSIFQCAAEGDSAISHLDPSADMLNPTSRAGPVGSITSLKQEFHTKHHLSDDEFVFRFNRRRTLARPSARPDFAEGVIQRHSLYLQHVGCAGTKAVSASPFSVRLPCQRP